MKSLIYRLPLILLLLVLYGISTEVSSRAVKAVTAAVSGTVVDAGGPVSGARVRVRATENFTLSDNNGDFTIDGLIPNEAVEVTAWSDGYYIASILVTPPASGVQLSLRRYHTIDHETYTWTSPSPGSLEKACGNCHPTILPQWENNAHGGAISNARFFSMYNGTDTSGTIQTGPGYLNDFPGTAGNCANCHAPGAAVDGYLTTDMNAARDEITAGIHCDYCHKVGGVFQDPANGNVYPNAPGVSSQRILRPPEGDEIFFGPYDDIPDPDTFLPQISESLFCAPCHQFSFWGTPIYDSFSEWLDSPYAEAGVTCQDCHMPPNGDDHYAPPEVGGLIHPPESIPSHLQLGVENLDLLQNSVELSTRMIQTGGKIAVTVEITNSEVGHHVPTDHPGRHLILTVKVLDEQDLPLTQLTGSQVPGWGGAQAGEPGKAFAKVLRDSTSGEYPVVSYWKQTSIVSDNRIPATESDLSSYTFKAPEAGETITLSVELRFRRLFEDSMLSKDWGTPDVIMEQFTRTRVVDPWWQVYLPLASVR